MSANQIQKPSWIFFLLSFASVISALTYVLTFSVNLPFWDEWEFVHLLEMENKGELELANIFSFHNEHRIPIPRLIMFSLAWATSYNTVAQNLFTVFHLSVLLFYVYFALHRNFNFPLGTAPIWFVPIAWLFLSWRQGENLIWGFQIGLTLPLTLSFIALFHLQTAFELNRRAVLHVLVAALASLAASFSSVMGLLIWPAGLCMAILHWPMGGFGRRIATFWIGLGLAAWFIYFIGYESPPHHPPLTSALLDPLRVLHFFLIICGGWAVGASNGALVGTLLLVLLGICLYPTEVPGQTCNLRDLDWSNFLLSHDARSHRYWPIGVPEHRVSECLHNVFAANRRKSYRSSCHHFQGTVSGPNPMGRHYDNAYLRGWHN